MGLQVDFHLKDKSEIRSKGIFLNILKKILFL